MAIKIIPSIYKINISQAENINFLKEKLIEKNDKFKERKIKEDVKFSVSEEYNFKKENFIVLYFAEEKNQISPIANFINEYLLEEKISKTPRTIENIIILISYKENIYAVTAGLKASNLIKQFSVKNDFGLYAAYYLAKESQDKQLIVSVDEKVFVGSVIADIRYFRGASQFGAEDNFGRIAKKINFKFKQNIIEYLNLEGLDKLNIMAKESFTIQNKLTFEQILTVIIKLDKIDINNEEHNPYPFNKINERNNSELIEKLNEELMEQLFVRFKATTNGKKSSFDFDLLHNDIIKYVNADKYEIFHNKKKVFEQPELLINADEIFKNNEFKKLLPLSLFNNQNKDKFKNIIKQLSIKTYYGNDEQTEGKFLAHIFGDITYDNKKYFYIDEQWYVLKDNFIESLNKNCEEFIKDNYHNDNGFLEKWKNGVPEKKYNMSHAGKNVIVLDRKTKDNDNIEMCDILKIDNGSLIFYHVKKGFDNSMREACSQVQIAAWNLQQSDKEKLKKFYDYFSKNYGNKNQLISKEDFTEKMLDRKIEKKFVLAIALEATDNRNLQSTSMKKFHSTIAKYQLRSLKSYMQTTNYKLEIIQIERQ